MLYQSDISNTGKAEQSNDTQNICILSSELAQNVSKVCRYVSTDSGRRFGLYRERMFFDLILHSTIQALIYLQSLLIRYF